MTPRPFLMFQDGNAEAAMTFYVSLFPNGRVNDVVRHGAEQGAFEGKIMLAKFTLGDQVVYCSDSYVKHAFDFTPSLSLYVEFESADELQRTYDALSEGGQLLMPLGEYGFSRRFGWVNDRFGVSWQLNMP